MCEPNKAPHLLNYFAYGSNLSLPRLSTRIPATPLALTTLPNHQLKFHKIGQDGSGKCDAAYTGNPKHAVHGRLFQIAPKDKPTLDRYEGLGNGYELIWHDFRVGDKIITGFFYRATHIDNNCVPFEWYRHHVWVGAKEAGLPREVIEQIEQQPVQKDADRSRHQREMSIYEEELGKG